MHFAKAVYDPFPKKPSVRAAALYLAFFFTVAVVSQLFTFEDFEAIISSYGLPVDQAFYLPIAALIVTVEVFAVPFYLSMKLSPLMKYVSIFCGWIALLFWMIVGLWQSLVSFYIPNAGLFGSKVNLPQGWWMVFYIAALITLAVYVHYYSLKLRSHKKRQATVNKNHS